jgi:hypothetical protein
VLDLEQVQVTAGGVAPEPKPPFARRPPGREEPPAIAALQADAIMLLRQVRTELGEATAPFAWSGLALQVGEAPGKVVLVATLHRDYPPGADERELLRRLAEKKLRAAVDLHLTQAPLLPPLVFAEDGALATESAATLAVIDQLPGGASGFRFEIRAAGRGNLRHARHLAGYLRERFGIAPENVLVTTDAAGAPPAVTLRITRRQGDLEVREP